METFDIFGLDSPCMDLNANLDALPQRNGGARLNDLSWQGGGKVSSGIIRKGDTVMALPSGKTSKIKSIVT